jgi:hypothetical protein
MAAKVAGLMVIAVKMLEPLTITLPSRAPLANFSEAVDFCLKFKGANS